MKAKLAHNRHQVHQFGRADIFQVEAFLDFTIGSVEAAYSILIKKVRQRRDGRRKYQGKEREDKEEGD